MDGAPPITSRRGQRRTGRAIPDTADDEGADIIIIGRSGLTVSCSTYESNDELGDRLALAGCPGEALFTRFRDQDRLQPFDTKIVTEDLLDHLDASFRSTAVDPGNRYSIP
jgi:hypothetical protein